MEPTQDTAIEALRHYCDVLSQSANKDRAERRMKGVEEVLRLAVDRRKQAEKG